MTKFIYRRAGSAAVVYRDEKLPFDPALGVEGARMEVAGVSDWSPVTTGPVVQMTQPSGASHLGRYLFSEGTGNTINDSSAFGQNGARSGYGASWQPEGLRFNGAFETSATVTVPYRAPMNTTGLHVFIAFKGEEDPTSTVLDRILVARDHLKTGRIWALRYRRNENTLMFNSFAGGKIIAPDSAVVKNAWHLYEVEIDERSVTLRRDGALLAVGQLSTPLRSNDTDLTFGNAPGGDNRSAPGIIGFAAIYRKALSVTEAAHAREDAAKAMLEKGIRLVTPPAARAASAPRFLALPTLSEKRAIAGTSIAFNLGRVAGDPMPVVDVTVTLDGVDITPEGVDVAPKKPGLLEVSVRASNGLHDDLVATAKAQILSDFVQMSASDVDKALSAGVKPTIASWEAGFPADIKWDPSHVVDAGEGRVGLRILPAPENSSRPYRGAEVQFVPKSASKDNGFRLGRYDSWMRLARGVPGTVQTAFLFQNPYTDKQREFDFEFIGAPPNPGTDKSGHGRMDCAIHMQPLTGGASQHIKVQCDVPDEAFDDFQKWSIVFNADRTEWLYNDRLMARYVQGKGFDDTVQTFNPTREDTGKPFKGPYLSPTDAKWQLNRLSFFAQHWCSSKYPAWLGPISLPADPPLLRLSKIEMTEFSAEAIRFGSKDWSVMAAGRRAVDIKVARLGPVGFTPTRLEYRINGGGWSDLGGSGTGTFRVDVPDSATAKVEIRAIAAGVNGDYTLTGDPSDVKAGPNFG